jgi:hypothetical protein
MAARHDAALSNLIANAIETATGERLLHSQRYAIADRVLDDLSFMGYHIMGPGTRGDDTFSDQPCRTCGDLVRTRDRDGYHELHGNRHVAICSGSGTTKIEKEDDGSPEHE